MPTTLNGTVTPVGPLAVQVYTPAVFGRPHCVLANRGTSTVYVGQASVSSQTGLPLPPGTEITIPNLASALYAVAGGLTTGTATTTTAALAAAGTSVTVTALTGITTGTLIRVGTTSSETVSVTGITTASSTVSFSAGAKLSHPSGAAVAVVTGAAAGVVLATSGVT